MRVRSRSWPGVVALLALVAGACQTDTGADLTAAPPRTLEAVLDTTVPPETTTTVVAVPTTTAADKPAGLGVGDIAPEVVGLEKKLEALRYYVGTADATYDGDTRDAVLAFQKVTGMDRTGRATDDVVAAINAAKPGVEPIVPNGGLRRVEVDLERQVLFLYDANNLKTILNVSSGSNERFCSEGWCRYAVTPPGSFTVYEKRSGWETGPLGSLYNAQYFNGAIAIHGSRSVPAYPASHGCIRISMNAAEWFPDELIVGTPVYVSNADDPHPQPIGASTRTSTPTTVVADKPVPAPTTSTTTPNLLNQLLAPPTTARPS